MNIGVSLRAASRLLPLPAARRSQISHSLIFSEGRKPISVKADFKAFSIHVSPWAFNLTAHL